MNTTDMHIPSNKVRDIERYFHTELAGLYPDSEITMFVRMLLEAFLGWSLTDLLLRRDDTVNQSNLLRFHWAAEDLKRFRPIQHIIGWTDFCGCRIEVDKNTLIPRPETEEIVNWTISHNSQFTIHNSQLTILDLCTGSGCIAIALAKQWPNAEVTAVDISEKTLAVAKRNAQANNVNVNFIQVDILSEFRIQNSKFEIIISNPPYVMDRERAVMQRNVLDWEPQQALFVPDSDPLLFYHAIAGIADKHLSDNGKIVLEINEQLGDETAAYFVSHGFATTLHRDFRGKPRMLSLHKK
ncbi:MAG: peptide chain release factor N(5)-glutamine methyltransferase [Bacteroidales bacterium]|nr:peptide chain release factor N(5)-glutamine methyltransferase [Bacteroidales bacterium]